MKNTLSLIGAIVVGIGVIVTAAIIVKKYVNNRVEKKKNNEELKQAECASCNEDLNWENIPVEEDEEDIIAESITELDDLDADKG